MVLNIIKKKIQSDEQETTNDSDPSIGIIVDIDVRALNRRHRW